MSRNVLQCFLHTIGVFKLPCWRDVTRLLSATKCVVDEGINRERSESVYCPETQMGEGLGSLLLLCRASSHLLRERDMFMRKLRGCVLLLQIVSCMSADLPKGCTWWTGITLRGDSRSPEKNLLPLRAVWLPARSLSPAGQRLGSYSCCTSVRNSSTEGPRDIGAVWHATRATADVVGSCSSNSMNNGHLATSDRWLRNLETLFSYSQSLLRKLRDLVNRGADCSQTILHQVQAILHEE